MNTVDSLELKNKRVLVRVDFNVPLSDGKITDDTRMVAAVDTIQKIRQKGGKVILMSHMGRPKGQVNKEFSLQQIVNHLSDLLNVKVLFSEDCVGSNAVEMANSLDEGDVLLLENLRFHAEEEAGDETFAKSLASTGAFIAGDQEIIDYLKYNLRSQMFAKSLQMQLVVGALKRLEMLKTMPELKKNLWTIVDALQSGLKARGFDIGTTQSCVTPVYLKGSIPEAMALVKDLRENYGIFCSIVVYPVIPKGLILLRMIPTATHTLQDVEETLDAFDAIRDRLDNGTYKRLSAALMAAMGE